MFKKFREKLKEALSLFSRKAQEEAEPAEEPETAEEPRAPIESKKPAPEPLRAKPEPAAVKQPKVPFQAKGKAAAEQPPSPVPKPGAKAPLPPAQETAQAQPGQPAPQPPEPRLSIPWERETEVTPARAQSPAAAPAQAHPQAPKPELQEQPPPPLAGEPLGEAAPAHKQSFFRRIFTKREQPGQASHAEPPSAQPAGASETAPTRRAADGSQQPPSKGIFTKAKELLTTRRLSGEKFDELFSDMEIALLENNVAVDVVHRIKADLRAKLLDKPLPRDLEAVVEQTLKDSLDGIISIEQLDMLRTAAAKKPFVIAFFGINGSGKTTTIAKVAALLQKHGLSTVIAAADTFRAAAIHQLEEHATRLNTRLIKHDYGADAAAVAFDAIKFARKNSSDVVLIDTAGRLHSDRNLMDELKKIVRVAKPDLKIFVGESITGNDCIEQSQQFNEHIGIDAIILTKADVDEKGGTAVSISYVTRKPILYLGTGQRYEDLQPFTKELVLEHLGLGA